MNVSLFLAFYDYNRENTEFTLKSVKKGFGSSIRTTAALKWLLFYVCMCLVASASFFFKFKNQL